MAPSDSLTNRDTTIRMVPAWSSNCGKLTNQQARYRGIAIGKMVDIEILGLRQAGNTPALSFSVSSIPWQGSSIKGQGQFEGCFSPAAVLTGKGR